MKRAGPRTLPNGGASPAKHGAVAISALDEPECLWGKERALAAPARRLGCATSLTRGREIIGDVGLNFGFSYLLAAADL